MLGYLLVFSLVGIVYNTWVTPIKGSTLHNTRTGLGGFSDRVGALAYALTPFTILLSNRESILSLITGIPHQHFNFLHRWLGRIMFVQAFLHTLGWTIIEGKLYQPQPSAYAGLMAEQYIIFGVVAMFLITLMLVLSTQTAIGWIGYEAFKLSHWIIAVLYIGACWGHWDKLWCWMVPSLALVVIDQAVRGLRTLYIHAGRREGSSFGFKCAEARISLLGTGDDLVVRLDFDYEHPEPWQAGQHFHVCFPSLSVWQSHPFTPSSSPDPNTKMQHHTYLLRVRKGQTARLAALGNAATVPAILSGPYGRAYPSYDAENVLAVAGGTGVTFAVPIVLAALKHQVAAKSALEFVWVVGKAQDILWLEPEMALLKSAMKASPNLRVKVFVTRDSEPHQGFGLDNEAEKGGVSRAASTASSDHAILESLLVQDIAGFSVSFLGDHHPAMAEIVDDFVDRSETVGGTMEIVGSGPEAMGSDLRSAVSNVRVAENLNFHWDSRA
ncbi:hypothetical protein LTR36_000182 [Oleoguttula mirabilis]|uniref:ferric-chelate reductase (NADPH) n=1 Tax=Oleoguttula mirabilis TaxID=1507867 RepID=A0AAV9JXT6_9PEZI|nr:hypothetical protein LTR36_000182 [Oleoguttula mirabilis]